MKKIPRRDLCFLRGKRAARLTYAQSATAWATLASELCSLGDIDLPKFKHLAEAIKKATIAGRQEPPTDSQHKLPT